jgi:hypothetical protein
LGRGPASRARFGFTDNSHQITLETKDGRKCTLEFARQAVVGPVFAGVTLDGDFWVFEFPRRVYEFVEGFLGIPPGP